MKHSGLRVLGAAVGAGRTPGNRRSLANAASRFAIHSICDILAYVYILELSDE
jgi:hypothetical protein